jgi:ribosomal protein S12 methylthiotransferase accessory factor
MAGRRSPTERAHGRRRAYARAPVPIPERPMLRWGCRAFACDDGLVIRGPSHALVVRAAACELVARVLGLLEGRSLGELCEAAGGSAQAVEVLAVLGQLAGEGLLVEREERSRPPRPLAAAQLPIRASVPLRVIGDDVVAGPLAAALSASGADVRRAPERAGQRGAAGEIALVCRAGPDLAGLAGACAAAREGGVAWIPVFILADEVITGPFVQPGSGPCFACFERRWVGIARSIACEHQFFERLRSGGWEEDRATAVAHGAWIAQAALPVVVDWLAGREDPAVVATTPLATGETKRHPLEQHPLCEACGGGIAPEPEESRGRAAWADEPVPLHRLAAHLERLADDRLGLVAVEETPEERRPAPGLPAVVLSRFSLSRPGRVREQDSWAHGCAPDAGDARAVAIVEALERYCGISPPRGEVSAPFDAVRADAVYPPDLPLFSDGQYARPGFRFSRFDPARPLRWLWGHGITAGRPRLVPSAAVHYSDDETLLEETSSGMAAHGARSRALLGAVLELVERDAFMIHWLNRLSPPLVEAEATQDPAVRRILQYVRGKGWVPRVADLTTDLEVPVFLALGSRDDARGHALLVGAGASTDPAAALLRAVRELYAATVAQPPSWTLPEPMRPEDVRRGQEHRGFYAHPRALAGAAFLWASSRRVPAPVPGAAPPEALAAVVERLAARGHEVIGVDLTAPDVARHGLRVVRAVVPGLQPLAFGPATLRLGGRRLYEAPVRMGHRATPILEAELNPDPHCFP